MRGVSKLTAILLAIPAMLIIAGLVIAYGYFLPRVAQSRPQAEQAAPVETSESVAGETVVTLPVGLAGFYDSIETAAGLDAPAPAGTRGGIVPHHDLAGDMIADWFARLNRRGEPRRFIIIAPDHAEKGSHEVVSANLVWRTPFGDVDTAATVTELAERDLLGLDKDTLVNEHGVGQLIPYVAHYFPEAEVLPVVLSAEVNLDEAEDLAKALDKLAGPDTAVIASLDFSHYLSSDQSAEKDRYTYKAIMERDYDTMAGFNSDYLDSPPGLMTFLTMMDLAGADCTSVTGHANSGDYLEQDIYSSTSYFSMFFHRPEESGEIVLGGDVMVGRGVESMMRRHGRVYPFTELSYLFSSADAVFTNLESVITDVEVTSSKEIRFKGDPETIPWMVETGFTHFSVVNNHVYDYGRAGWEDSVDLLGRAGLQTVGDTGNAGEAVLTEVNGVGVAMLAFEDTVLSFDRTAAEDLVAQAAAEADLVIVSIHWGQEYQHQFNFHQQELAHALIDSGADFVMGHHPHVLQGVERYGNGLIFYSFGNLIFDQYHRDDVKDSMVAVLRLSGGEPAGIELIPLRLTDYKPGYVLLRNRAEKLAAVAEVSQVELRESIRQGFIDLVED
jgi:poly-gamma-glutamate synthesis protein (capsule biosynthesis protein)